VALTRILLQGRFGATDVRYVRRPVEAGATPNGDAWLLIGDAALRARRTVERDGLYLLDLGKTWEEWTGLPFVYAVWTVRASLPTEEKARLEAFLERSLEEGERSIDAITAGAAIADPTLGDAPTLSTYLRAFRYRLGPDEEKGLAKFRELWAALEGATP